MHMIPAPFPTKPRRDKPSNVTRLLPGGRSGPCKKSLLDMNDGIG